MGAGESLQDLGVQVDSGGGTGAPPAGLEALGVVPGQPSPEVPIRAMGLHPAADIPEGLRFSNEFFFGGDPAASANFYRSRGYEAPTHDKPAGAPLSMSLGGAAELGKRGLNLLASSPRMAAMGIGALGGGALGIETGPGALATGALGAGAADAAASAGLSHIGRNLAGLPDTGDVMPAAYGAFEGTTGHVVGTAANALFGKAVNFFRDKLDTTQGVAKLMSIFRVSPDTVGKDTMEAAQAVAQGFAQESELGLENHLEKVITDPKVIDLMKAAQVTPGNTLGKNLPEGVADAMKTAGEVLHGIEGQPGTGAVAQVDKLPNSAFNWNDWHEQSAKIISEVTEEMNLSAGGADMGTKASMVRSALEREQQAFKVGQTQEASAKASQLNQMMGLLKNGAKDDKGNVIDGITQIEEKLAPLQKVVDSNQTFTKAEQAQYQDLSKQLVDAKNELTSTTQEYLTAKAHAENPTISFKTADDHVSTIGTQAGFDKKSGDVTVAAAMKRYYGKMADMLKAHAEASSETAAAETAKLGTPEAIAEAQKMATAGKDYKEAKRVFSVLSDFSKIIPRAVGIANTIPGKTTGLAPVTLGQIGQMTAKEAATKAAAGAEYVAGRVVRPLAQGLGIAKEGLTDNSGLTINADFARTMRLLPDAGDPSAAYRGNMLTNMAAQFSEKAATQVFGVPLSRQVSKYVPVASAQGAEPDLTDLKNGATLSILIDSGKIPPNSRQAGADLSQVDAQTMMEANQQVMMALQPLNDAIKFGNEDEIGAAYSQVAKQFPELFPAPKTGIKGEVEDSQGRVKLYDPTDRARYMSQVQVDSELGWDEKAKIVSELNNTFTVLNPKRPK